jgi:hypothetical protein
MKLNYQNIFFFFFQVITEATSKLRAKKHFLLKKISILLFILLTVMGHDQLLEICLLEKTGRHNFSTGRHHSSK